MHECRPGQRCCSFPKRTTPPPISRRTASPRTCATFPSLSPSARTAACAGLTSPMNVGSCTSVQLARWHHPSFCIELPFRAAGCAGTVHAVCPPLTPFTSSPANSVRQ